MNQLTPTHLKPEREENIYVDLFKNHDYTRLSGNKHLNTVNDFVFAGWIFLEFCEVRLLGILGRKYSRLGVVC